jgi:hypothetical protein
MNASIVLLNKKDLASSDHPAYISITSGLQMNNIYTLIKRGKTIDSVGLITSRRYIFLRVYDLSSAGIKDPDSNGLTVAA